MQNWLQFSDPDTTTPRFKLKKMFCSSGKKSARWDIYQPSRLSHTKRLDVIQSMTEPLNAPLEYSGAFSCKMYKMYKM